MSASYKHNVLKHFPNFLNMSIMLQREISCSKIHQPKLYLLNLFEKKKQIQLLFIDDEKFCSFFPHFFL